MMQETDQVTVDNVEPALVVTQEDYGAVRVIAAKGEVDAASCHVMRSAIFAAPDEGFRWLVVDMRNVSYADSCGLRVLIASYKMLQGIDGAMTVLTSDPVLRLLEVTGQYDRFVLSEDLNEAMRLVQKGSSK